VEEALRSKMQDMLTPESYRMLAKALRESIAEFTAGNDSMRAHTYELQHLRKDGSIVTTETLITLIPDQRGSIGQIQGISRDATERKFLQRQLVQAQKMEAIGRLAGGIAHDFNNLLTVIIGYSDSILNSLPKDAPNREELEVIKRSGDRAAALTSKLLAFSRKQILQPKIIDLKALIEDCLKLLRRLIGENIELIAATAPDVGFVKADMTQIEQVIMNLAVNSRDSMPQGGKLTLEVSNASLDKAFAIDHIGALPGEYIMMAISDTGTGMDAETISHIFEPFFTTKEEGKGTGLGLATVYGIIKQSGGFIYVDSALGQGTTFKIYLPRIDGVVERAQSRMPISPKGSETILLAEDSDDVRVLTSRILQERGYTVVQAIDGSSAVKIAEQHVGIIHLLITDMVMPGGMSGYDVYKAVLSLYPDIAALVITGYSGELAGESALNPKIPILPKPFTADDLLRRVNEVLQEREASKVNHRA
jgi:signal transduction histidine kinase/CheY-like chemotaxis protein